jgi:DNA methylase
MDTYKLIVYAKKPGRPGVVAFIRLLRCKRSARLNIASTYSGAACNARRRQVCGRTHNFYRYPARFSPRFARAAIQTFTRPGDLVLDPYVGGGTSLVEALAIGRDAIGIRYQPPRRICVACEDDCFCRNRSRQVRRMGSAGANSDSPPQDQHPTRRLRGGRLLQVSR